MNQNPQNIIEEIDNKHSILKLREDGIIEIIWVENHSFDVNDVIQNHEAIRKLSKGKKALVLNITAKYSSATREARDFVAKGSHANIVKAEAFIAHSLAHNILAKFYLKVNKPVVKTSAFSSVEDATKWLKSIK